MDSEIERWKMINDDRKPTIQEYDEIISRWIRKDMVVKFIGIFSTERLYEDWMSAEPDKSKRDEALWEEFISAMQQFYKPTENITIKHYEFRSIAQGVQESFTAFCNHVEKEAKHCSYKCTHDDCIAENTAIRDQIIIETLNDRIKEDVLKNSWDVQNLRKNGMHI